MAAPAQRVAVSPAALKQRLGVLALGAMRHVRAVAALSKDEDLAAVVMTLWQRRSWALVATNVGLRLARDPRLLGKAREHSFDWDDLTAVWSDGQRATLSFAEVDVDVLGGPRDEIARLVAEARAHLDHGVRAPVDAIRTIAEQSLERVSRHAYKLTIEGLADRLEPGERVELLAVAKLDFRGLLVLTDRRLLLLDDDKVRRAKRRQWAVARADIQAADPIDDGLRLALDGGDAELRHLRLEQRDEFVAALGAERQRVEGTEQLSPTGNVGVARTLYKINQVGMAICGIGAAVALIAIFLPWVNPPNGIPVTDNSVLQGQSRVAVTYAVLAVIAAGLTFRYYWRRSPGWGVAVTGLILAGAAFSNANDSGAYTLDYPLTDPPDISALDDLSSLIPDTTGSAGLGIYAAGLGGALILVGGWAMKRSSEAIVDADSAS